MVFADEMRLGLPSQLRRRWFGRGVKLRQKQQMQFVWKWLYLCVEAGTGKLRWLWQSDMKKESMAAALGAWQAEQVDTVVWDNAPSHKAKVLREAGPGLSFLPPYSPELNPAERVFEEVRRAVEGRLWASIDAKQEAVEAFLIVLAADTSRVKRLAGWQWIQEAVANLPPKQQVVST